MQLLSDLKSRLDPTVRPVNAADTHSVDLSRPRVEPEFSGRKGAAVEAEARPAETASARQANDAARWSELMSEGNRFKLFGAVRLDMIFDSQRPNNAQSPLFIPSGTGSENFTMHPRLTTFGVDYMGPEISTLGDGRLSGKLMIDFQNGGSEFTQVPRILEAYLRMDWGDVFVLGGQKWDTVSPLRPIVNDDSVMFTAGNVGLRRPQLLFGYDPKTEGASISIVGGFGLTGAVDAADLDLNGVRDGEESGAPNLQGRIGVSGPSWVPDQRASIGISGVYGFLETATPVFGRTHFRSRLANIDFTLPLAEFLSFRGEGWWGRNMSDFGGGAGQGFTFRNVRGRGGWAELGIKAGEYFSTHPGFTTDDPRDGDLFGGGITRNRAFYWGNRIKPNANLLIGVDYLRWKTNFRGLVRGLNNRLNLFFQYNF
jgi:hypothetical protein